MEIYSDNDYEEDHVLEEVKSTKKPISRKRKEISRNKEDDLLDEAMQVLQGKKDVGQEDSEDIFGKNVASCLKNVPNSNIREYVKFKIQELLYQAQCGMMTLPKPQMSTPSLTCQQYARITLPSSHQNQNNTQSYQQECPTELSSPPPLRASTPQYPTRFFIDDINSPMPTSSPEHFKLFK